MRKPTAKWGLLATIVLLGCLFLARGMFWLPAIASHDGDGSLRDLSHRAGPFAVPGFSIRMPDFSLAKPFKAEYRLANVPSIGRKCGLYFAIQDSDERLGFGGWHSQKVQGGEIRLDLVNSSGATVVQVSGKPKEFIWYGFTDTEKGYHHALYQLDRSFFYPSTNEEYTLRISYAPDSELASFRGFAYLECGGHK